MPQNEEALISPSCSLSRTSLARLSRRQGSTSSVGSAASAAAAAAVGASSRRDARGPRDRASLRGKGTGAGGDGGRRARTTVARARARHGRFHDDNDNGNGDSHNRVFAPVSPAYSRSFTSCASRERPDEAQDESSGVEHDQDRSPSPDHDASRTRIATGTNQGQQQQQRPRHQPLLLPRGHFRHQQHQRQRGARPAPIGLAAAAATAAARAAERHGPVSSPALTISGGGDAGATAIASDAGPAQTADSVATAALDAERVAGARAMRGALDGLRSERDSLAEACKRLERERETASAELREGAARARELEQARGLLEREKAVLLGTCAELEADLEACERGECGAAVEAEDRARELEMRTVRLEDDRKETSRLVRFSVGSGFLLWQRRRLVFWRAWLGFSPETLITFVVCEGFRACAGRGLKW